MFLRWLRLYATRQPLILRFSLVILTGVLVGLYLAPLLALSLLFLSLALLFLPTNRPNRSCRLAFLVFVLAGGRVALFAAGPPPSQTWPPDLSWWRSHGGRVVTLAGVVKSAPERWGNTGRLRLTALYDVANGQKIPGEIEVILPRFAASTYVEGEKLAVAGRWEGYLEPERSSAGPRVTSAVFGRLYYPRVIKTSLPPLSPGGFFARARQRGVDLLAAYLPEPEASLAAGVVLGKKTGLADDFGENLRRTGLTHVVVASGYNISIVVFFMMALTRFLGKGLNFFLTTALAVLYALLCGGGWPVWRAVLMASFVLLAKVGGREKEALSALFLSAAFITLLQPQSLRDPSFQLSFLATLGLLLFSEPLLSWLATVWPRRLRSKTLAEGLATTLAAQIATFPVLVYNFGQVSLVAPLTNFLIFAVIPYLMWLSLALLLAALAAPVLAPAFAALAYLPLTYFVRLAGFFGQFSWTLLRF